MNRGLCSSKTNPTTSAPASDAAIASGAFVIPQILTLTDMPPLSFHDPPPPTTSFQPCPQVIRVDSHPFVVLTPSEFNSWQTRLLPIKSRFSFFAAGSAHASKKKPSSAPNP